MTAASLINISYGARCAAKKVEEKSEGKSQHPRGRASFSPNLYMSPELNKKSKNTKPSDVRLNSPGLYLYCFTFSNNDSIIVNTATAPAVNS